MLRQCTHPRFDAIICDIDGCLCPETSRPFDLESLATVAAHNRRAQERRDRPVLTLCSGRPQPFAESMSRLIANTTMPLIAENGVWMYHPATNTYQMDPAISRDHRHSVRAAADWLDTRFAQEGVQQQPGKAASVSLYHPRPEYLKSICPEIEAMFERQGWPMRVSMTWNYINCDLKHISKGTGLERLFAAADLEPSRLAGIGDTMGDMPIRERVAWFACPGNAAQGLKERADFVAEAEEARGVVEILNLIDRAL